MAGVKVLREWERSHLAGIWSHLARICGGRGLRLESLVGTKLVVLVCPQGAPLSPSPWLHLELNAGAHHFAGSGGCFESSSAPESKWSWPVA